MSTFFKDVRYSVRMLAKSAGFTAAAVVCLALGIGATSAIFSVVHAVLLRPLGYKDPARLVRLYTEFPTFPNGGLRRFPTSPPEYDELARELHSWETLDAWATGGVNLAGAADPIRVNSCAVTGGLLGSLGVPPEIGRLITPQDDIQGATPTVVISHGLWERAFGKDPGVIGQSSTDQRTKRQSCRGDAAGIFVSSRERCPHLNYGSRCNWVRLIPSGAAAISCSC